MCKGHSQMWIIRTSDENKSLHQMDNEKTNDNYRLEDFLNSNYRSEDFLRVTDDLYKNQTKNNRKKQIYKIKGNFMNKDKVRSIIKSTLISGDKAPGLFELPKIMELKSKLESCFSINEVVGILEDNDNRCLISKSFGLSDAAFYESMEKIKTLGAAAT